MSTRLLSPTFLFRFSADCGYRRPLWSKTNGTDLDEAYRLPNLGGLNSQACFSEVRAGWSEEGIGFRLIVTGKSEPPETNPTRFESSDAIGIWIDTRNTQNIHRASRFCHRFLFLPAGGGRREEEAIGFMMRINRAKEDPKTFNSDFLPAKCTLNKRGYTLDGLIPAKQLSGFDPVEHHRIGFFYAVTDLQMGWNTWFNSPEFPFAEDPSLWGTLDLKPEKK